MVVVDYSTSNDRYRRNENDEGIDRRQLLLDYDTAVNSTITNFCPKLRQAVSLLSRHKVGKLANFYFRCNIYNYINFC